jgi:glc operon protein GlcG
MKTSKIYRGTAAILAGALMASATAASAQNLNKFVVTGAAAEKALATTEISLDTARKIVDFCLAWSKQNNKSMSIFILSPSGQIVTSARMDGLGPVQIDTALMKAKTALYMRDQTTTWTSRLNNNLQTEVRFLPLGQYWVPGGLPIIVDKVLIGAIGVGGSDQDPECAHAALTAVLGPQPPIAPRPPPTQPFPTNREPAPAR